MKVENIMNVKHILMNYKNMKNIHMKNENKNINKENKKYILYIGAMVMPDQNAIAQRVIALSKSILDISYVPIIIGLDYNIPNNQNILTTKKTYCNIDYYAIHYPSNTSEWLNRMLSINKYIEIMKKYGIKNIHSIIAVDYEIIALYRLELFCKKNNIFLIADNVEWYEKSKRPFPQNVIKDIDTYLRMKIFYAHASNMICISRFLYQYYKKADKNKNVVMIPVTIDKEDNKWKNLPDYIPNEIFTFVYAGNPGDYCIKERLDWLIQAICKVNEQGYPCKLIIIGVEKTKFEQEYSGLKTSEGYHNVSFLGSISHMECINEIRKADMFAIIREDRLVTKAGFPTKLAEGIGCGTPVLTTPSSNINEFVIHGDVGFVTKGFKYEDIEDMVLQAVQMDKTKLILIHQRCNKFERLNYNNYNKAFEDFFQHLKR